MKEVSRRIKGAVLVIGGVGLITAFFVEWTAYRDVVRRYRAALEQRTQLELELSTLRTERDQLADALRVEQQEVEQLAQALSDRSRELQEVLGRLAEEEQVIQALQEKFFAMERQVGLMQGELATSLQTQPAGSSGTPAATVQLEKVLVTSAGSSPRPGLHGRIISVDREWRFVVIDLGWDVVNIGDIVSIYRNEELLGKARVERVQEEACAATLLPEWIDAEIQVNDVVRAL